MASPRLHVLSTHNLRQLKFILPGIAVTYLFNTHRIFLSLLTSPSPGDWSRWGVLQIYFLQQLIGNRPAAFLALCLGALVVLLFLYVLIVPWLQGIEPDYRSWRQSGVLSCVIPTLTAAIVAGWSLLSITLGKWTNLGYLKGTIGASGLYALVFGLMGLLPAPKIPRS
ncbi:hypothetical protein BS17DRAFT_705798 [Gyrodon lividus]|nr:hypothetical protein BS17DRAFT_705798 [Gyrodon lividus]